jgi:hypothetical protein
MPSPEHAAELERMLTRAAEECESGTAWFGQGLPQALKDALEAAGKAVGSDSPRLAFVEVGQAVEPPRSAARVVALSAGGIEDLPSMVRSLQGSKSRVARLICPVAVLDFTAEGIRVREIRHGLTAADLQDRLDAPLWSGPDLKELGSH